MQHQRQRTWRTPRRGSRSVPIVLLNPVIAESGECDERYEVRLSFFDVRAWSSGRYA